MKAFLISKGFEFREYPDGWFWVLLKDENIYQADDSLKYFTSVIEGWVYKYSEQDFIEVVENLK